MTRITLIVFLFAATPSFSSDGHDHAETGADHSHEEHAHDHDQDGHDADDSASHVTEAYGLRAVHAWTRATTEETALVFLEFENQSDKPSILSGASTDIAEAAEIVGFSLGDGSGSYAPLPELPVSPGASLRFAPQELAIRLTGLATDLDAGGHIDVILATDRGPIPLDVEIGDADATRHSHAGHAH